MFEKTHSDSVNYLHNMEKSAAKNGGQLYVFAACNVNAAMNCEMLVMPAKVLETPNWARCCTSWGNSSHWSGNTVKKVYPLLRLFILDRFSIGVPYKALPKNDNGDRSTALELACMEYAKQWRPNLEWKYLGAHRGKGWRDLAGYNPDGTRAVLVEIKGRQGRME